MTAWKGIVDRAFTAAEFDAYCAGIALAGWRPRFVVVHNTAAPTLAQWHGPTPAAQRVQNLVHYYRDMMGWSAGPHLFVADDSIWTFTPLTTSGVHSPSWNAVSWGVEIVGDYDIEHFDATKPNAIAALAALHRLGGLDPHGMRLHLEDPLTTHRHCPGRNVVKTDLIAGVKAKLMLAEPGEHLSSRTAI